MQKFDVIVVGGSVAGCAVAKHCAEAGLSVAVLEEHPKPGKYGRCTAIVSKRGLDSIGAEYSKSVLCEIHGANIFCRHSRLCVRTKQVQAIVLDRFLFDESCAKAAKAAGARFFFDTRFISLSQSASGVAVVAGKGASALRFESKVLVGADGATSAVAKAAKFPLLAQSDFSICYEAEYSGASVADSSMVDVFVDSKRLCGLFGWAVPCGKNRVRIGFGTTRHHNLLAAKSWFFGLSRVKSYLPAKARVEREFHALIPLRVRSRTQDGNILLVGDAAGQAKATTGGGIVFASRCAQIAAKEIAAFVKRGKPMDYERAWRAKYGRTLSGHRKLRSLLDFIPPRLASVLLRTASILGLGFLLERFGDMDDIARL